MKKYSWARVSLLTLLLLASCSIFPISLADRTFYQISGYRELCTEKNGSYYDIDQGVSPDYRLDAYADFYNRTALTSYIDSVL